MEVSIVKLKKVVGDLLEWVRADLIAHTSTPTLSWLYLEFHGVEIDGRNFYTDLKSLIEKDDTDRRKLEVRLMFDKERANLPTFHIHYPSEDGQSGDNTVGTGYQTGEDENGNTVNQFSRSFIGQYELIITAGNSLEVVMLYEFIDALLIAGADTLTYYFDIFKFSGKQLMANQELIPLPIFFRAIGISLQCKKIVRSLIQPTVATDIDFIPEFYGDDQEPALLEVSVSIAVNNLTPHIGNTVVFTATPINSGESPVYNWYKGINVISGQTGGTLSYHFSTVETIEVHCQVTSSLEYLADREDVSNTITLTSLT